ncbi:MAG: hypothetical protein H0Z55_05365 [Nitrosarchaeum sp.]|nr:hypothetical protein [Nitrosarchaeum sp.]
MEFVITILHYHKGNDIDKVLFGKKLNQNRINEDIRIFPIGGLKKNGGLQEKYIKINLKNNTDFNLDLLSDFLAHRLTPMDDADSLKIGNNTIELKKEKIKSALQMHLDELKI